MNLTSSVALCTIACKGIMIDWSYRMMGVGSDEGVLEFVVLLDLLWTS